MSFDSLVTRLEASLLPAVRGEEDRIRTSGRFSEVEVVSLRHADVLHAMGIACRPIWASKDMERLSFSATISGFAGLSGRIDLQWSQTFTPSTGSGYVKKESRGFHSKLESDIDITRFEGEWSHLLMLFLKVALRGSPSHCFVRRLRGAPPDIHGMKEEANKSPETRTTGGPVSA